VFTAMRLISGFEGTFFHIAGQMWIADIFEPVSRHLFETGLGDIQKANMNS